MKALAFGAKTLDTQILRSEAFFRVKEHNEERQTRSSLTWRGTRTATTKRLTSLPHGNCQTCPLSAKSTPSKRTKLTPKIQKGRRQAACRARHSQQMPSTVGHGYNPSTLQAVAGDQDQECEESLTSYKEAEAKGVGGDPQPEV